MRYWIQNTAGNYANIITAGVGVTKPISLVSLFTNFSALYKTLVSY